jgi:hypothetical protein
VPHHAWKRPAVGGVDFGAIREKVEQLIAGLQKNKDAKTN